MKTLKRKRGMAGTDATAAAAPVLVLASSCTVKDAADLKITLIGHLDVKSCVLLDATHLERIDTAVMQLLCAFVRDRGKRGLKVQWQGTSAALLDAAEMLDLRTPLGLDEANAAGAAA